MEGHNCLLQSCYCAPRSGEESERKALLRRRDTPFPIKKAPRSLTPTAFLAKGGGSDAARCRSPSAPSPRHREPTPPAAMVGSLDLPRAGFLLWLLLLLGFCFKARTKDIWIYRSTSHKLLFDLSTLGGNRIGTRLPFLLLRPANFGGREGEAGPAP